MPGDLVKGVTFAAGETVTHTRLNNLVDEATIRPGAVGTTELADLSVTSAKLASGLSWLPANISVAENKVIVGNASAQGVETALDAGEFVVSAGTLSLATAGIDASKLAGGILNTQLAGGIPSTKLTSVMTAGTYGSATKVPRLTFDAAGRATGVTETTVTMPYTAVQGAVPARGSSTAIVLGAVPVTFEVWMTVTDPGGDAGFSEADLVPLFGFVASSYAPALSYYVRGATVHVVRVNDGALSVLSPGGGSTIWHSVTSSKWRVEVRFR